MKSSATEHWILLALTAVALIVSGIDPYDRITWLLEVAPVLIGAPILILTYRKFRLTNLLYRLIFIHALILILGGAYTYARVPAGFWVQEMFDLSRNPYDKLGHFFQGFMPAILARELLLRHTPLRRGGWLFLIVVSICMAFSSFYELIEWWTALLAGSGAEDFLGTQGDVWDTQSDMFLAMIGATAALLTLSRRHDKELGRLHRRTI